MFQMTHDLAPNWYYVDAAELTHLQLDALKIDTSLIERDQFDTTGSRFRCGARGTMCLETGSIHWRTPDCVTSHGARFLFSLAKQTNPEYSGRTRDFQWFPESFL